MPKYFFLFVTMAAILIGQENYKQIKLFLNEKSDLLKIEETGIAADHAFQTKDGAVTLFVPASKMQLLDNLGLRYEILIEDWYAHFNNRKKLTQLEKSSLLNSVQVEHNISNFSFGSMGGYFTLSELMTELSLMQLDYGNIISKIDTIGFSNEHRPIISIKISDNPNMNEDEPEVLYTALHHAREPEGLMQMVFFMYYLLENYGTDEEATYLVDNREIYFIPVVNPDGYYENERTNPNGGGMWRKNKRDHDGVDLNRNYGPYEYWNAPNGGSSTNPSSNTYRGTEPFSEPETSALRDFLNTHNIKACLNYHTHGDLLISPYGALEKESPDSSIFREFGSEMTYYNNYLFGTDQQTVGYSTRGNSDDYMYDGEPGREKIITMTPEVGQQFWPLEDEIIPLAEENLFPNLYYARVAGSYSEVIGFTKDAEFVQADKSFTIFPSVKNKGLSDAENLEIKITAISENLSLLSDNALLIELLESRETVDLQDGFIMSASGEASPGDELLFSFNVLENGFSTAKDTFSLRFGIPSILFSDNADSLEQYWETNNPGQNYRKWSTTKEYFVSEPSSYTESKNRNYIFDSEVILTGKKSIDLRFVDNAFLNFYSRYITEPVYDVGFVEVSVDSGSTWEKLHGVSTRDSKISKSGKFNVGDPVYFGPQYNWVKEEIDLSDFIGNEILLRFVFISDETRQLEGWNIDDISVLTYDSSTGSPVEAKENKYNLDQNYPNPFNPVTTIRFSLAERSHTVLIIYDLLGSEVTRLINEEREAGKYEIKFNGAELASGIYFYKLTAGEYSSTKKMMLIK